jgi:hypothetical protein
MHLMFSTKESYAWPSTQKSVLLIVKKNQQKVLYVHLDDNLCSFVQFHEKAIFQAMQKRQKLSREKPYFNINFCLLYSARTTSRFFVEKHCADIPSEDIIVNFLFGVFDN